VARAWSVSAHFSNQRKARLLTADLQPLLTRRFTLEVDGRASTDPWASSYGGLAIHLRVLNRLQNFLLYSPFQRVTNQLI
jgi:hypothetical protein